MSSIERKTEKHYDSFPFEFLTKKGEHNIEELQPKPFVYFVENFLKKNSNVIDVGCGGGRATLYLERYGLKPFAFDLSMQSLLLTRARCRIASFACGTNLSLPFKTEIFDAVISDGVIHHTPDAIQSLKENIRILKRGGYLYLAVYRREGYYFYIYTYLGKPIRWLAKYKWGEFAVTYTMGVLYFLIQLVRKKCITTWSGAKNFFYDYILTPKASFHKKQEFDAIVKDFKLEQLFYEGGFGNIHVFIFKKSCDE